MPAASHQPSRRARWTAGVLLLTALALSVAAIVDSQQAGSGAWRGPIAFVSSSAGNPEIFSAATLDSEPERLTRDASTDGSPAWSADGSRLAFVSDRDGDLEIYLIEADGSGLEQLTSDPAEDLFPAWSPDQQQLVFVSERDAGESSRDYDGNAEIYVINADGSGLRRVTNHPADDIHPAWSPDGARIAFASGRDGDFDIYVLDLRGGTIDQMTNGPGIDWEPAWSPDGRFIAFTYAPASKLPRDVAWLSLVELETGEVTRLTRELWSDSGPAWSPDGDALLFSSTRDGEAELFVMPIEAPRAARALGLVGSQAAWAGL